MLGPGKRKDGHLWLVLSTEGSGSGIKKDGISKLHSSGFPKISWLAITSAFLFKNLSFTSGITRIRSLFSLTTGRVFTTICGGFPAGIA